MTYYTGGDYYNPDLEGNFEPDLDPDPESYVLPPRPKGRPNMYWQAIADDASDDGSGNDAIGYDWSFDPAFPIIWLFPESYEDDPDLWEALATDNVYHTDRCQPFPRTGEQFYDSYFGWWNSDRAKAGNDCPVIVFDPGCKTWDGWHRMLIARLCHLITAPVIVGVRKEAS